MKIKKGLFITITFILIISIGFFVMAGLKGYNYIGLSGMIPISVFILVMLFCLEKKIIQIEVTQ